MLTDSPVSDETHHIALIEPLPDLVEPPQLDLFGQEPQTIPTRDQIVQLQEAMLPIQCAQSDPTHFFAPGMYLRELTVPSGMLLVGKTHKHTHFLVVTKGRAEVLSEFGRTIVEPGHISISQPGVKRVVLALEDTQFITVHLNSSDTQDLEVIEAEHIEPEVLGISAPEHKEQLS